VAKHKPFGDNHIEVAKHLDFLSRSPAYKGYRIITWSTGGANIIGAAMDLSDRGFLGVEKTLSGLEPMVTITIARDRVPRMLEMVNNSTAGGA